MNNCEWAASLTALAIAIAKDKTDSEIIFLSRLFAQLSTSLSLLGTANPCEIKEEEEEM